MKRLVSSIALQIVAVFAATISLHFTAAKAAEPVFVIGGANVQPKVTSIREWKYLTTVGQQYDFSCGSAAIATLLTHHYNRPTTEVDAFKAMWEVGDQDRIRELGFSLFEMKSYVETLGLVADGFKLALDRVETIGVPGIALIDVNGYKHFVVIKGVSHSHVLFGDPSKGIDVMKREDFEEVWDGVILFIRSDVQTGKKNFNSFNDWRLVPAGPTDEARQHETLQSFLLGQQRPSTSGFGLSSFTTVREIGFN